MKCGSCAMDKAKLYEYIQKGVSIYDMPLRVVDYNRVSTDKDAQLHSLKAQSVYYPDYIKSIPSWIYAGSYSDEGITGTSTKRRGGFKQMIDDAMRGDFDLIITKEVSRFARNTLDSITYTRKLLQAGIGVFFQNDNINTLDKDGELRLTIMSSIAQDESRKTSERCKFGFKRAQEHGVVLGQSNIYGYDKKDGALRINEEEAEMIRYVFATYAEGRFGLRRIARELESQGIVAKNGNMLNYATLYGIITNPKYKGWYAGRKSTTVDFIEKTKVPLPQDEWILYRDSSGRVPAIVDEDTWDRANALLKERGKRFRDKSSGFQNRYAYSGKILCGEHDAAYHRHVYKSKRAGERECWNCRLYRLKGKENGCDSPTIYTSELDEILGRIYRELRGNVDAICDELLAQYKEELQRADHAPRIASIREELMAIEGKKDKLLELAVGEYIGKEEFRKKHTALCELAARREAELAQLERASADLKDTEAALARIRRALKSEYACGGCDTINAVMLERIVVHKNPDKEHLLLDIYLRLGGLYSVSYMPKEHAYSIMYADMGISQAQVSRLEKNALRHMRKYV